jgi:DNA polymerase-3 subunit epsilon
MREIVFDTETTGLDPRTGDRMVEIGCIEVVGRMPTGRQYHAYFNPQRDMPAEAERVHGLSATFLADKPCFPDKALELLEFIADSHLVAHNAQFDFAFLNHELSLCGHPPVCPTRMIDTVALARKRHPGAKHSLDALCSRYGIDRSHRVLHGALLDAELLAQVYIELTGGRQIGFDLAAESAAQAAAAAVFRPRTGAFRPARPHMASAEELARHQAFLQSLSIGAWAH